ncbi:MAG: tRNA (adenosine(37)-N6)-threonylcarbamoyltransferase complex dimerization subunit type 1 TsaB [Burkholderiaceae bacterium]|nr:tRNA (adenosine(37)-N6)-threonylcarbamoyltransferase complex dimerization subunit type 1 TsaB [Microbacteriaceae bacterium]
MLLAIDTSAGTTVAVVDRDRGIIAERSSADTRAHSEVIGDFIAGCLADSGVPTTAISCVVAGMGPGPFTGLRVGIAAAQAFALGAGVPVVRVVSHDAIAADLFAAELAATGSTGPLLVVTDARRREVYWSAYRGLDDAGLPARDGEPGLARPAELAEVVPGFDGYRRVDATEVSGGALGMLAERMFASGREFASATPLYLRSPDVTVPGAPKRVS